MKTMKPLLIELLLITLTVCASSSYPSESTQSPLGEAILGDFNVTLKTQPKEIRLNITLKSDETEKENIDVDMGKYSFS